MKKTLYFLILLLLLSGCTQSHKNTEKTIKASKLTDLIFEEDKLLPNREADWNMEVDVFVEDIYGGDMLNPEHENFDQYRYSHSEEQGITTLEPSILYQIDGISQKASVGYAFNEEGLYSSAYHWTFKEGESVRADVNKAVRTLADDFNSNPYLTGEIVEIPDFRNIETMELPYRLTWRMADSSEPYIELSLNQYQSWITVIVNVIGSERYCEQYQETESGI